MSTLFEQPVSAVPKWTRKPRFNAANLCINHFSMNSSSEEYALCLCKFNMLTDYWKINQMKILITIMMTTMSAQTLRELSRNLWRGRKFIPSRQVPEQRVTNGLTLKLSLRRGQEEASVTLPALLCLEVLCFCLLSQVNHKHQRTTVAYLSATVIPFLFFDLYRCLTSTKKWDMRPVGRSIVSE